MLSLSQQLLTISPELSQPAAGSGARPGDVNSATSGHASFPQEFSRLLGNASENTQSIDLKELIGSIISPAEAVLEASPGFETQSLQLNQGKTSASAHAGIKLESQPIESFPLASTLTLSPSGSGNQPAGGNLIPESGKTLPLQSVETAQLPKPFLGGVATIDELQGASIKQIQTEAVQSTITHPGHSRFQGEAIQPLLSRFAESTEQRDAPRIELEELIERIEISSQSNNKFANERTLGSTSNYLTSSLQSAALNVANPATADVVNNTMQAMAQSQTGTDIAVKLQHFMDTQLTQDSVRANANTAEPVLREQVASAYGSPRWFNDFAGRIRVIANANVPMAELSLNPAELGAIEIKIHAQDEGTIINFFSSNSTTRELIDSSLPRLRELLADSGIQLQHGDVSDRKNGTSNTETPDKHWNSVDAQSLEIPLADLPGVPQPESTSLIDHYV